MIGRITRAISCPFARTSQKVVVMALFPLAYLSMMHPMAKDVKSRIRERAAKQRARSRRQAIAPKHLATRTIGHDRELDALVLYSAKAACYALGISRTTLYRRIREGSLAAIKTCGAPNGHYRFRLKDLEAFNSKVAKLAIRECRRNKGLRAGSLAMRQTHSSPDIAA